jgi:hypothetical protein
MNITARRRAAAVPIVLAALLVSACSSSGMDTGDAESGVPQASVADDSDAGGSADGVAADESAAQSRASRPVSVGDQQIADGELNRAVISKGVVSLESDDVGAARFDVGKVVDAHAGEITDEKTETDDDGSVLRSRLIVRVPVADFDATMTELQKVASLSSASRTSEDVTTEVIDTEVRIRAQSESLRRVELLLARAQSIRDIVAIEAQLTRRQADLDSLKQRQAFLADQTSMSTITVYLEKTPPTATPDEEEASGFVAGLSSGWDSMTAFLTGLATVTGALLPFALLFALLGVPVWLLLRSLARRRPTQVAPAGPSEE